MKSKIFRLLNCLGIFHVWNYRAEIECDLPKFENLLKRLFVNNYSVHNADIPFQGIINHGKKEIGGILGNHFMHHWRMAFQNAKYFDSHKKVYIYLQFGEFYVSLAIYLVFSFFLLMLGKISLVLPALIGLHLFRLLGNNIYIFFFNLRMGRFFDKHRIKIKFNYNVPFRLTKRAYFKAIDELESTEALPIQNSCKS